MLLPVFCNPFFSMKGQGIVPGDAVIRAGQIILAVVEIGWGLEDPGEGIKKQIIGEHSVFMGTELLDGLGMGVLIGRRKIDPQGDPDYVVLERGSGVGQFHVFSMVGYIDHGLQRKLFRLLEYSPSGQNPYSAGSDGTRAFFQFYLPRSNAAFPHRPGESGDHNGNGCPSDAGR